MKKGTVAARAGRLVFAFCLLGLSGRGHSARCLDNRDFQQNLPAEIGKEDTTRKYPFALQCDTVFVRKGVTTTVHPGTYLYFAKTSLNSVIKVEGTLILRGTKNSYVYLSGSLDTSRGGYEPGEKPWGGIEVAEGGKLIMEFVGMAHAPTPITAFSKQVTIVNSFFKGSSGMILPDGSLMAMDPKWNAVNDLDLSKTKDSDSPKPAVAEGGLSQDEKEALLDEKKGTRFWTWQKTAGGAALLAAMIVGAGIYFSPGEDASQVPSLAKKNTLDPPPPTPDGSSP
jgi:hypothetical protein